MLILNRVEDLKEADTLKEVVILKEVDTLKEVMVEIATVEVITAAVVVHRAETVAVEDLNREIAIFNKRSTIPMKNMGSKNNSNTGKKTSILTNLSV